MSNLKSTIMGAGLIVFSVLNAASAFAQSSDGDVEEALNLVLEESKTCHATDLDSTNLNFESAISSCQMSVAGLVTIASAGGEDLGLETLYLLSDTAGTSSMMWAAIELKKSGTVNSAVCQPVGMAISLYDLLETSAAAKSKEGSGANTLAGMCKDAGISIN